MTQLRGKRGKRIKAHIETTNNATLNTQHVGGEVTSIENHESPTPVMRRWI